MAAPNRCDQVPCDCHAAEHEAATNEHTCDMQYIDMLSGEELYPTEAYGCTVCKHVTHEGCPNYCPNCGARVIEVLDDAE